MRIAEKGKKSICRSPENIQTRIKVAVLDNVLEVWKLAMIALLERRDQVCTLTLYKSRDPVTASFHASTNRCQEYSLWRLAYSTRELCWCTLQNKAIVIISSVIPVIFE
jgi:hypothetical protein